MIGPAFARLCALPALSILPGCSQQDIGADEAAELLQALGPASDGPRHVAIIGAGAAGSSAAYHLRKYADEAGLPIALTIFDRTDRIGGRTLTVNAYQDPQLPVELGASIFVEVNRILYGAARDFNLTLKDPGSDEPGDLGIWDGQSFVFRQSSNDWKWWGLAKLVWKYGTAPYHTRTLVRKTVTSFLRLYEEPHFPFISLTARLFDLGLVNITGLTGLQFLAENKLDGLFARQIVQTATRVNYASNLAYIHGMGAMVSLAAEGSVAVKGGNWQIFSKMVEASGARLCLNSSVTSIALKQAGQPTSSPPKQPGPSPPSFLVRTSVAGTRSQLYPALFDDVIIATPLQFSDISTEEGLIQHPIDEIPYVKLHVTLFASPFRFSPDFFKLKPGARVPTSVLTTLQEGEEALPFPDGVGKVAFYSATLVKVVTNPRTNGTEYVYKIFSPSKVTPGFLSSLLGVKVPDSFTRPFEAEEDKERDDVDPISWYHPWTVHPYPQEFPRLTFQDPVLRQGLYYTSGIESFISTMETSALMGKNVARLIVDDYLDVTAAKSKAEEFAPDQTVIRGDEL